MQVQPYIFFDGRCEEAAEFYKQALGATVTMAMRFKDSPQPVQPPAIPEKIMHMQMTIGDTTVLASDGHCKGNASFQGFALTLVVKTDAEAQRFFAALSDGGQVQMPLAKTFFSSNFGMLSDRFGVMWMIYVGP
jgi:PhnB protein